MFVQNDCADVDLFYRVKRMILTASVALQQQLTAAECMSCQNNQSLFFLSAQEACYCSLVSKLEGEVKQILDGLERSPAKIKEYFNHPRIGLAEELSENILLLLQPKLCCSSSQCYFRKDYQSSREVRRLVENSDGRRRQQLFSSWYEFRQRCIIQVRPKKIS